ncbi:MAG: hypothetical protein A2474_00840 [Elusimicrobia bacterium RIFOXYC2_FULL_34_12]|nr:MAG: hypothetical protein A2474_00840 [Elusimicrobia bacterium RIFOXYC2_FULL_34_12]OGS38869.1 MAG: hypothetical protein A2551_03330 [Elusimicrobia bacterium RIFOXYD2_FULL_34_30]
MNKAFFLITGYFVLNIIGEFVLPVYAQAENEYYSLKLNKFNLSGYAEINKRSTSEDFEEEDTDDDYTYKNYHIKFGQQVSGRLNYDFSSFIYSKDYNAKDYLDNVSKIFKTNWSYYIKKNKEQVIELGLNLKYREKRYESSPKNEYNQFTAVPAFSYAKKDFYTIDLSAGIDNFNYLEPKENIQHKLFGKIGGKRYFLDKKLALTSSYRVERLNKENINRKRTKHDIMGGFDYIFDILPIYKITTRINRGQRDTKDEDNRDEDYDYEYQQYYTKTAHKISSKLNTNIKYQYFKKDYITADLDHKGFYIQNGWDYEILDYEKSRIWLDLGLEHKDADYSLKTINSYKKETAEIKINYIRKKDRYTDNAGWKISTSLEGNYYNFEDFNDDKSRYYGRLSGEKYFVDGNLVLGLDFKYRYTDYELKDDTVRDAVRVTFRYNY